MYTHIYIHTCIHLHMCAYPYTYVYTHTYIFIYVYHMMRVLTYGYLIYISFLAATQIRGPGGRQLLCGFDPHTLLSIFLVGPKDMDLT